MSFETAVYTVQAYRGLCSESSAISFTVLLLIRHDRTS